MDVQTTTDSVLWTEATKAAESLEKWVAQFSDPSLEKLCEKIKEQRKLFLSQIEELKRLLETQRKLTEQEGNADLVRVALEKTGDPMMLPLDVQEELLELFSVKDHLSAEETQLIAQKYGCPKDAVAQFFIQNRNLVQEIVEEANLKLPSIPKPPKLQKINSGTDMNNDTNGLQEQSSRELDQMGGSVGRQNPASTLEPPNQDVVLEDAAEKLQGETSPHDNRAQRKVRSVNRKSIDLDRAKQARVLPSRDDDELMSEREDRLVEESILRLNELKDPAGGLNQMSSAGTLLMLMREEKKVLVRKALLEIILCTQTRQFLERLSNQTFYFILERWIAEREKLRDFDTLKMILDVIGHVRSEMALLKACGIRKAVARLSNKCPNAEVTEAAQKLLAVWQGKRPGTGPVRTGSGGAYPGGISPGIQRLASGDAKQQGKVMILSNPDSAGAKRGPVRKPSIGRKHERPLTTSEILERQERQRKLMQAGVVVPPTNTVSPVSFGRETPNEQGRQVEKRQWEVGRVSVGHQSVPRTSPRPLGGVQHNVQQHDQHPTLLTRSMSVGPSDPQFYVQQQNLYNVIRNERVQEERVTAERDALRTGDMQPRCPWVHPPRVEFTVSNPPMAFGEGSNESRTLMERDTYTRAVVPQPDQSPLEPPAGPAPDNSRAPGWPFTPTSTAEFQEQHQKLITKGVRKLELVQGRAVGTVGSVGRPVMMTNAAMQGGNAAGLYLAQANSEFRQVQRPRLMQGGAVGYAGYHHNQGRHGGMGFGGRGRR